MSEAPSASSVSLLGVLAQHQSIEWSHRHSISTSRYGTDFTVLRRIGHGSFGTVYQVRHKLDGRIYALNRVKLSSLESDIKTTNSQRFSISDDNEVIREVQMLSGIQHENVVRYYGAWVERHDENAFIEHDHLDPNDGNHTGQSFNSDHLFSTMSSDSPVAHPKRTQICHLCSTPYVDWEVSFEQWGLIDSVLQPLDLCTNCYLTSLPKSIDPSEIHIREQQQMANYLYILMEYCDGAFMDIIQKCSSNPIEMMSYFIQCLKGLEYLHNSGIIHRDIKPNNIFVLDAVVKIGDLGLATTSILSPFSVTNDDNIEPSKNTEESSSTSLSFVGTYLYAAPEVKHGAYSEKCDIYSMGVVLVEMFSTFGTGMERVRTLEKLQSGIIPEDFVSRFPDQARLARRMLDVQPTARPSCHEILETLTCAVAPMQKSFHNDELLNRIMQLEELVAKKDEIIRNLHHVLQDHGIQPPL